MTTLSLVLAPALFRARRSSNCCFVALAEYHNDVESAFDAIVDGKFELVHRLLVSLAALILVTDGEEAGKISTHTCCTCG